MRTTREMQWRKHLLAGAAMIVMVLLLAIFADAFSIVSHAESAAKVTATSAKIRKEPNSSSEVVGSTERDKVISIKSQVQGSDGYTWYEVYIDSNTLGYIRSDLVEITDGTTPPSGTAPSTSTQAPPTQTAAPPVADEPLVAVTAVNPASANVTNGNPSVRVRQNASTTSRILTTVENGMALTITGSATGTDNKTWYQVTFIANGAEVAGFIRSDYTTVKPEELTPYTEEPPVIDQPPVEEPPVTDPEPVEQKAYETMLVGDEWRLVDTAANESYGIQTLFDGVEENGKLYTDSLKTVKNQKIIIIILVMLLIAASGAVALLILKVKDMADAQYFSEVENETMRRRGAKSQGGQKVMQTVGGERQGNRASGAAQGQRPQGAPQGQKRPSGQNQRPQGSGQGQPRPAGQGQRPQGGGRPQSDVQGQQRPAAQGQRPQGSGRPQGAGQGQPRPAAQGQRPQGSGQGQPRPAAQGQRPQGSGRPQGDVQGQQRSAAQGQRPQGGGTAQGRQNSGWQAKNFMADDEDDFEFEFLNYDGDDEK